MLIFGLFISFFLPDSIAIMNKSYFNKLAVDNLLWILYLI